MAQDIKYHSFIQSVQSFSHVRLCNLMDCSMPGLPVHHQLLEFTQTHVHWVSDAIQPSHPLSSPSSLPSIFPSIRVIFFASGGQSIGASALASVLPMHGLVGSPCGPRDSQEFSATRQVNQFFSTQLFFIIQLSHPYMTTGKTTVLTRWTFVGKLSPLLQYTV